jgi:F-type H+-transporting ATPase subunit b
MASYSSPSSPPPPAERGAEIADKLPSHASLITKTGTAILGSGLLTTATSQKLGVFNEETVIAVGYFILFAYVAKVRTLSALGGEFLFFFSLGGLLVV